MMVKICGITNAPDAAAAVDGGASALGFNFYMKSPRYIQVKAAAVIIRKLPDEVLKVGVFVDAPEEVVARTVAELGLDIAQLHGDCGTPPGARLWRAVRVTADFSPDQLNGAEAFLLDTPSPSLHGGTGLTFDWTRARSERHRIIVAGGLDENNVGTAIRQARPWGVDACSRLECAPGRKNHLKMARFLKAALRDNQI